MIEMPTKYNIATINSSHGGPLKISRKVEDEKGISLVILDTTCNKENTQ